MNSKQIESRFLQASTTERLPTLPEVANRLIELAQQPDPDFSEVCRVIKADPAISCKILKTVNSALFAFRPRVETIEQAVPKLGTSLIRTLILSFHLSAVSVRDEHFKQTFQQLWKSCLSQAVFAEWLAEKTSRDPAYFFMAGLLQDIGTLAMVSEFGDEYIDSVLDSAQFPNVAAAEKDHFGFNHVGVTLEILKRWNLSTTYANIVRAHHHRCSNANSSSGQKLGVSILQAASMGTDLMVRKKFSSHEVEDELTQWLAFLGTHFDLTDEDAETMFDGVQERVNEYSVVFDFDIGTPLCADQLMHKAKDILHEIALNNQINLLTKTELNPKRKPEHNEIYRDCLTQLYNRRFLNEILADKVDKWFEAKLSVALMFIDADKFKSINDNYGHSAGDTAIQHIGSWLNKNTRGSDCVVRIGGDEFLVVMQIDGQHFDRIANRIVNEIPALKLSDGTSLPLSLSAGGVMYVPADGDSVDFNSLIDHADQMMYRTKKQGGADCLISRFTEQGVADNASALV